MLGIISQKVLSIFHSFIGFLVVLVFIICLFRNRDLIRLDWLASNSQGSICLHLPVLGL